MEFRLLGPVEVHAGGRRLHAGPPQQRAVLAALLVDADRPVMPETLVARVWDDSAVAGARRALHAHLSRIRNLLAEAGAEGASEAHLTRQAGGYVLQVGDHQVDLHLFRHLAARARRPDHPAQRRAELGEAALGLWRGTPLADVPNGWAARTRTGWLRERMDVALGWAEVALELGRHVEVVGVVEQLSDEYPLAEPLIAVHLRALTAGDRRAEALHVYAVARDRLVDELGTEPGPHLQGLHRAILRGDLRPAAVPRSRLSHVDGLPAQLPADIRGFVGRAEQLGQLSGILDRAATEPTAVVISAVSGTAGVGKTALAVRWAHQVAGRFPDGQLYVNLHGFDATGQVMEPVAALRGFLEALNVPAERIPTEPQAQAALYRSLLSGKRMLILLDNARDSAQVRPLLPGSAGCLVVVTSRNQLTSLTAEHAAHHVAIDLLTRDEARHLLAARLHPDHVAAEPDAVTQIVGYCARLPLALALVAAHAAIRPHVPLRALAGQLRDARRRWHVLAGDDPATDVRSVFSWSYHALSPATAHLFRLLGLHCGPDVSLSAAASLTGLPPAEVRNRLAEMTRAHLLIEHVPGRYSTHDLLRAYAADLADTEIPDTERDAATYRLLDYYGHAADAAVHLLHPQFAPNPVPAASMAPGTHREPLSTREQALAWLNSERPVLLAALRRASDQALHRYAWHLSYAVHRYLDCWGYRQDNQVVARVARDAVEHLDSPEAQACAHVMSGRSALSLRIDTDAQREFECALGLYEQVGDLIGQAETHHNFCVLWDRQGRFDRMLIHAEQQRSIAEAAGDQARRGNALHALGWCHSQLGDLARALAYCREATDVLHEQQDQYGAACAWDSLGYVHSHLGNHAQAIRCYERSMVICRDIGARDVEGLAHVGHGDAHRRAGDIAKARAAWSQAREILADLDHPETEKVEARLRDLESASRPQGVGGYGLEQDERHGTL